MNEHLCYVYNQISVMLYKIFTFTDIIENNFLQIGLACYKYQISYAKTYE